MFDILKNLLALYTGSQSGCCTTSHHVLILDRKGKERQALLCPLNRREKDSWNLPLCHMVTQLQSTLREPAFSWAHATSNRISILLAREREQH